MEMMAGRVTDFIVTPEGKFVSGVALATYMITNIPGINQVQLYQEEVSSLKIRLIKGENYTARTADMLLDNARKFLGGGMRFEVEYVDSIPKSSSGKSLFSISRVSPLSSSRDSA